MTKQIVVGLSALVLAACGGAGGDPLDDGATAPEVKPGSVSKPWISGTVTSSSAARAALADSDVCLWDPDAVRCTKTSPTGRYEVASTSEARIGVFFEKAGHARALVDVREPQETLFADVFLIPDADAAAFADVAGRRHDPTTTGGIVVASHAFGYDRMIPLADVTVTLHGVEGTGAVYADAEGHADTTLSATSEAGWAAAIGLASGQATLDVRHADPGVVCTTFWDGHRGLDRPIEATVYGGHVTMILVACLPKDLVAR